MDNLIEYIQQREAVKDAEVKQLQHHLYASGSKYEDMILANAIQSFAEAVYNKARLAREKYGFHPLGWAHPDWQQELQKGIAEHLLKGDPRDVAVYAVFAWFHDWPTAPKVECSPADLLPTVCVETGLGVLTVSQEDVDKAGGFSAWLKESGYLSEDETEDDIPHWTGPTMTREAYNALPELN